MHVKDIKVFLKKESVKSKQTNKTRENCQSFTEEEKKSQYYRESNENFSDN